MLTQSEPVTFALSRKQPRIVAVLGLSWVVVSVVLGSCRPAAPVDSAPLLRHVDPETLAAPGGYTHVVEARGGRTLYLSGQVALDSEGNVVGAGDLVAQTEQVFENLRLALEGVGAGFDDVVKFNFYLTDFSRLDELRAIRDRYVDRERPPASTAVGVRRLFREDFLIEVDAIAVVDD